jgi:hypothetical protein
LKIISRLAGALQRNSREPPGPQSLARGLRRLHDVLRGQRLLSRNFAVNVTRASRPRPDCPAAGGLRRSMARMAMPRRAKGKFPALRTRPRRSEIP